MEKQISLIKSTILEIRKPFKMEELFDELKQKGITNRMLIYKVLDMMLNEGLVSHDDIKGTTTIYRSIFCY